MLTDKRRGSVEHGDYQHFLGRIFEQDDGDARVAKSASVRAVQIYL